MSVRFEDHSSFQNAALWSAVGGAAFGAFGGLPLAVAGSALALSVACAEAGWRNRLLAAGACAATAVAWLVTAHRWSSWACGATPALLLAAIRAGDLQRQYAELANRGQSATDAVAKDSYLRAAEALSGRSRSISVCARSERCPEGGYRRFAATSLAAFSMNAATDFGCDT